MSGRETPVPHDVKGRSPMQNELHTRLRALQDHYTEAVNAAVAEGRDDLVAELVADYPDAAMRMLGGAEHQHAA